MDYIEKTPWEKMNMYLAHCITNATTYPGSMNIVFELSNMLYSFAKPGMLDRDLVEKVEKLLNEHMRKMSDNSI